MTRSPWFGPLLAGLGTALVVLVCSWPLALHPTERILGPSHADFYSIAWGMDHVARQLFEGQWIAGHTTRLEWPRGAALTVTDMPEMVLMAPVTALLGAAFAFNLLQLLHHALAAAAAWWCARTVGLALPGRAIAATAFGFAPALVSTTFNQNPDVSIWYWIPLAAGFAASAKGPGRAALAGCCAGAAAWCNPYGAIMAAVAVLLLLPGRSWKRWAALLGPLVVVGGAGALMAWLSVRDPSSAVYKPGGPAVVYSASSLLDLVRPWPEVHVNNEWEQTRFIHDSYLGVSLLLLGVVGAVRARRWRWLALAAVAVLLALGPIFRVGNRELLANPVWLLGNRLGLDVLWHYHRYTVLAVLALAMGAGWLAQRLGRWGWVLVAVVGLDLLVVSGAWQRLGSVEIYDDGACELLAELDPGPVFDTPPGGHEVWLYGGVCHGNPVSSGINRPYGRHLASLLRVFAASDALKGAALLRAEGFRYLVYHASGPSGPVPDGMIRATAACEKRRNDRGVRVIDLVDCSLSFPKVKTSVRFQDDAPPAHWRPPQGDGPWRPGEDRPVEHSVKDASAGEARRDASR